LFSCNAFAQEKVYQKGLLAVQEQPKAERKYAPNGTLYDFRQDLFWSVETCHNQHEEW